MLHERVMTKENNKQVMGNVHKLLEINVTMQRFSLECGMQQA